MITINTNLNLESLKRPSLPFDLLESYTFNHSCHSYFGGIPFDNSVHICSGCNKNLDFIFQLYFPSVDDNSDNKLYSFFYCHSCRPFSGDLGFHVSCIKNPDFNKISIDSSIRSPHKYAFFDFHFKWQLPDWDYLHLISNKTKILFSDSYPKNPEESYYLESEHICDKEFEDSFNFIGGFPKFLDAPIIPFCNSNCREQYDLFIQLDSQPSLDLKWNDSGCLYVFKCPKEDVFKFFIQ